MLEDVLRYFFKVLYYCIDGLLFDTGSLILTYSGKVFWFSIPHKITFHKGLKEYILILSKTLSKVYIEGLDTSQ